MTAKEFHQIACKFVVEKRARKEPVQMEYAVPELIKMQGDISGDGAPLAQLATYPYVWEVLKKIIPKFDAQRGDRQMIFQDESFIDLLESYPMLRGESHEIVDIDDLTDEELEGRAKEYEAHGLGSFNHAREIRRYLAIRRASRQ